MLGPGSWDDARVVLGGPPQRFRHAFPLLDPAGTYKGALARTSQVPQDRRALSVSSAWACDSEYAHPHRLTLPGLSLVSGPWSSLCC